MSENTDYTTATEEVEVKPTYEVLEALLVESQNDLARQKTLTDNFEARFNRATGRIGDAGNYIKDNIDEDWTEHAVEILKALDLPHTSQHTMTVTIEATITVEGPLGSNFDLSTYDFDIDTLDISCNERGFEVVECGDSSIEDLSS